MAFQIANTTQCHILKNKPRWEKQCAQRICIKRLIAYDFMYKLIKNELLCPCILLKYCLLMNFLK